MLGQDRSLRGSSLKLVLNNPPETHNSVGVVKLVIIFLKTTNNDSHGRIWKRCLSCSGLAMSDDDDDNSSCSYCQIKL